MKTIKPFFIVVALLVVLSCDNRTKEIDFDIVSGAEKLVLNCLLNTDSVVSVQITHSYGLDEPPLEPISDYYVPNAIVILYENDTFKDTLVYDNNGSYYAANGFKPQPNNSYYISVAATGYETAYSLPETVPNPTTIAAWFYQDTIGVYVPSAYQNPFQGVNQTVSRLTYQFNDPTEANYYALKANIQTINIEQPVLLYFYDVLGCKPKGYPSVIEDICFNGSDATVIVDIIPYQNISLTNQDSLTVELWSVSENYYKFAISREAYTIQSDAIFEAPFNLFSNVKNGYGIVAAYSKSKLKIGLDE